MFMLEGHSGTDAINAHDQDILGTDIVIQSAALVAQTYSWHRTGNCPGCDKGPGGKRLGRQRVGRCHVGHPWAVEFGQHLEHLYLTPWGPSMFSE